MNIRCRYHMSKVAFEIPKAFEIETTTGHELPDDLVSALLDLNEGNRYESADICTPYLLIIDCGDMPTVAWINAQQSRINKVLADYRINNGMPESKV